MVDKLFIATSYLFYFAKVLFVCRWHKDEHPERHERKQLVLKHSILIVIVLAWPRTLLAQQQSYYYCEELHVYYPQVQICPQGWRQVLQPPPKRPEEPKEPPLPRAVPVPRVVAEELPPLVQREVVLATAPVLPASADPAQISFASGWLTLFPLIGGLVVALIVRAKVKAARLSQAGIIKPRAKGSDANGS
jgi:hypothetical protein